MEDREKFLVQKRTARKRWKVLAFYLVSYLIPTQFKQKMKKKQKTIGNQEGIGNHILREGEAERIKKSKQEALFFKKSVFIKKNQLHLLKQSILNINDPGLTKIEYHIEVKNSFCPTLRNYEFHSRKTSQMAYFIPIFGGLAFCVSVQRSAILVTMQLAYNSHWPIAQMPLLYL